ncbi:MAG: acyl carrier protein [Flavisolibacter sp.]
MTESEMKAFIVAQLKNIAPETEPAALGPDENIRTALEIDSFDYLQFIVALDEQFGLETPEQDYGKMETLRTLTQYLKEKTPSPQK